MVCRMAAFEYIFLTLHRRATPGVTGRSKMWQVVSSAELIEGGGE